jgi:hypothetical protein
MDDNESLIESLLGRTLKYVAAEIELTKLKALNKTADAVSSLVPHAAVFFIVLLFLLFFNLGLALWLNDLLGNSYYGFFAIAAFYAIVGLVMHFLLHKRIKRKISDYLVKQMFL